MSQAFLRYDGISSTAGWSFSFGPGVAPSTAVITMPPDVNINQGVANMVLTQDSVNIRFTDCRVSRIMRTGQGRNLRVTIQDRRWKWKYGRIYGSFNEQKIKDGTQTLLREKTPQELATLLLEEMRETGFDISQLPNVARPAAVWVAANPAAELESLAGSLGCLVVLNPLTDKVELAKIGNGGSLPPGNKRVQSSSPVTSAAQPDELRVITGPVLFQTDIELGEAVGIDTDGSIKPIADLSYTSEKGYPYLDMGANGIVGEYEDPRDGKTKHNVDLAEASVYKMYQITGLKGGGWTPKALEDSELAPESREDLEFMDFQIERVASGDEENRKAAIVTGSYLDDPSALVNTPEGTQVKTNFSIDNERGLVEFSEPVVAVVEGTKAHTSPTLILHAAFEASKDGVKLRHEEFITSNGTTYNTGPLALHHPDIIREVIEGDNASDNVDDVKAEADHYLQGEAAKFESVASIDAVYARIHSVAIDGVNRQITWSGGGGKAAMTQVSQNQEHNTYLPSFEDKQRNGERDRATRESQGKGRESKR